MGKSSSKDRKSIKLNPGKRKQFESTLVDLRLHYGPLLANWPQMADRQKQETLADSPVLSGYMQLFEPLFRS